MAKRYHESKKHKKSFMAEHDLRHKYLEDEGMIQEDHYAVANLPQDVKMKPYPPYGGYMPDILDDTRRGIDEMMEESDEKVREFIKPRKA